ncbi:MAG: 2-phospho-L-lactate guanylyltransferase [Anaerolineae bacterium]|nr:2-phospho-L-lactate guanylyltransferase [Anaerolineae bacterium]
MKPARRDMGVWVIVPVKPLNQAKTRLSQVLSPEERQHLAETMLRHVLGVVQHVPQLMGTLVISRDNKALSIAREYGARTVQESGAPELNAALMRATQVISRLNGSAILILPADLPLIIQEDVQGIIRMGEDEPSVVISTDKHQDGTNAMFIRPPGLFDYAYGPGSFRRHIDKAREVGAEVHIYESERLSLDIDMPADLKFYSELSQGYASS